MVDRALRVVQLNVGSLLEPAWAERRLEVVAWLHHLEPDVVCFEEVWQDDNTENTAGWVADNVPDLGYHWSFGGAPFSAELWPDQSLRFGSAVLSRWPIDHSKHHLLPIGPAEEIFLRGVPWELFHVRTAGLDVFACHLAPAPTHGPHRQLQVLAIDEIIREARGDLDTLGTPGHRREAMPPILCGDFNAEPESDEIRFLCALTALDEHTAFYQDAWRAAAEGPGYTQDWRGNPIANSMNLNRKRIDYVFVGDPYWRAGSAGRVLAAGLAFHEPLTGVLASDHYGLCVDIAWPQRPE